MNHRLLVARIGGIRRDGRTVWLTTDDRWTLDPSEAELIEDEAHGDIRLLEADTGAQGVRDVRLVDVSAEDRLAS